MIKLCPDSSNAKKASFLFWVPLSLKIGSNGLWSVMMVNSLFDIKYGLYLFTASWQASASS